MKPTRMLTNSRPVAEKVDKQCPGCRRHAHLMSGRAKPAARYPLPLCDAILAGMRIEKEWTLFSAWETVLALEDMCDPMDSVEVMEEPQEVARPATAEEVTMPVSTPVTAEEAMSVEDAAPRRRFGQ